MRDGGKEGFLVWIGCFFGFGFGFLGGVTMSGVATDIQQEGTRDAKCPHFCVRTVKSQKNTHESW